MIRFLTALVLFGAAGATGYFLTSTLGREILRRETEQQLASLMRGPVSIDQVKLVWRRGLVLEGKDLAIYPGPAGAGLRARHALARLDLLSLLIGRFRLRSLTVEGLHMQIERDARGKWSPYPIAALSRRGSSGNAEDPERPLALTRAFEATTRTLLQQAVVAPLVEIRDGSVALVDWTAQTENHRPLSLRVEQITAKLDHRWFSPEAKLQLRGLFIDAEGRRSPIEAEGRRRAEGSLRLTLSATDLGLEAFRAYAKRLGSEAELAGLLSGVVAFETPAMRNGLLEIDWLIRDLVSAVPRGDAQVRIEAPLAEFHCRLEIHPGRVRLAQATLKGSRVEFKLAGVVERPIRDDSQARLSVDLYGADLPVVRRFMESLPKSDSEALLELFERVESGEIAWIGGSGSTRYAEWKRLIAGELTVLPVGFVLGAELRDITLGTSARDRLTELGGLMEWSGDRIELRDLHASWNGEALPSVDFALDGVSHLLAGSEEESRLGADASPVPGLGPLIEIAQQFASEESAETAPLPAIVLEIEELHHPAFGWPVRDTQVVIEPIEHGVQVVILDGSWAGAPISGEAVWLREPEQRVSVILEARPRPLVEELPDSSAPPADPAATSRAGDLGAESPPPSQPEPAPPASGPSSSKWASGRFSIGAVDRGPLAFRTLEGRFAATGSVLSLAAIRAELDPTGSLRGYARLALDRPEVVGINMNLQLEDGDMSRLAGVLGFPRDFSTGLVAVEGSLVGELEPGRPLLSGLEGFVSVKARDGELRQRLPLLVALANATEGFNPFSDRDSVHYEAIETVLHFDRGRVSTDQFTIEGPMRIFASGHIDVDSTPARLEAVVGVFLLRQADLVLGNLPIIRSLIPGSNKGLVGAYFEVSGSLEDPEVTTLPAKTLVEGMPSIVKAPLKVLQFLLGGSGKSPPERPTSAPEEQPANLATEIEPRRPAASETEALP
ncbi:MAG: AsmA-like C-terminal region-containing protein [Myxococcota bacterium]